MSDINVLSAAQMQALTDAGLAHPQHDTVAAFAYYDGSWWVHASRKSHDQVPRGEEAEGDAVWFRADDIDLAGDHTFHPQHISSI